MTALHYPQLGVTLRSVPARPGQMETFEVLLDDGAVIGFLGRETHATTPREWVREMFRGRHPSQIDLRQDRWIASTVDLRHGGAGRPVADEAAPLDALCRLLLHAR